MINSMTAFARESGESGVGNLAVEIRTVNHRYLDCVFKLPEPLRGLEPAWRELVNKKLARGKLDCQVRWQATEGTSSNIDVNQDKLQALQAAIAQVEQTLGNCSTPDPLQVLAWPGVLEGGSADEDALRSQATQLFETALESLREHRGREGEKLAGFIRERLQGVKEEVEKTRVLMPELLAQQRQKLEQRVAEIGEQIEGQTLDPQRLEQELVLLAQKSDVDEELDRLQAHVEEVERVLNKGGPCGRRLDFLMQELNREANTLSSKSISSNSTQNAVELKVLIEQMREQIQNLE